MIEAIKPVLENNYVIWSISILILSVSAIYLLAFFQGRSVSFWPPAIGKRKLARKHKSDESTNIDTSFYVNRKSYYNRYYSLVSNAKESVLMIGDGFACHELDNREYAGGLIGAIRSALESGVLVKRFQYHTTLSLSWLHMLCDLKEEYGDLFQVYMHKEYDPVALPYVICLVDNGKENSSVNVMFTRSSDTSLEEKFAGPAFIFSDGVELERLMELMRLSVNDFFQRKYNFGCAELLNLYDQLRESRKNEILEYFSLPDNLNVDSVSAGNVARELGILDVELVLDTAVKEISDRGELYFAYGSNVDKERIRKRCRSARIIAVGKLKNHEIIFNMIGNKSEGKGGGIANIRRANGSHVYGVLYRIDAGELDKLNTLEISMNYEIEKLDISVSELVSATAIVYICKEKSEDIYVPTRSYKEFILNGMKERKFPEDYRESVKSKMES